LTLLASLLNIDPVCLYLDKRRKKYCGNLRFEPLIFEESQLLSTATFTPDTPILLSSSRLPVRCLAASPRHLDLGLTRSAGPTGFSLSTLTRHRGTL
jgi:hypothetical protein